LFAVLIAVIRVSLVRCKEEDKKKEKRVEETYVVKEEISSWKVNA